MDAKRKTLPLYLHITLLSVGLVAVTGLVLRHFGDVLPGLDLDLFAGGMFEEGDQFASTIASVESYWAGLGMTWRFGRGAVECGDWR